MSKVLFINAKSQSVHEMEVYSLEQMQELVGGYIEAVPYIKQLGASKLVVDEEGLMKGYAYGFSLDGNQFAGNGFIGTMGKTNTKVKVADLVGRLAWLKKP